MGVYIDADYLAEVVGEQVMYEVVGARFTSSAQVDLAGASELAAINRAIATAEGIADAKLGHRLSAAELEALDDAGQGEAIRDAIARIALCKLVPVSLPISEEITKAHDRACSLLKDIGKGEYAAGRNDPREPAKHTALVHTAADRGLDYLNRV